MVSQRLLTAKTVSDNSDSIKENANASLSETKSNARMMNACQSIFIIAALAYSATSVDAFSTARHSTSSRRNISTHNPIVKNPAFITTSTSTATTAATINQRIKSGVYTLPMLFATKKEMLPQERASKSDEKEWNALLAAFQMYKAAYGDLKVPSRFVVPSMPPWPGKLKLQHMHEESNTHKHAHTLSY